MRFGINRWKAERALVWAIFSIAWMAVSSRVVLHFHLDDSRWGLVIAVCSFIWLIVKPNSSARARFARAATTLIANLISIGLA